MDGTVTLAIVGGTFDPVHIGHLILAEEVRSQFGYDMVLFVPASIPAHKPASHGASPEDRLQMLRAAIDGVSGFATDDCEIRRGGVSYTIDTIRHVARSYPLSGKPGLVVGDDLIAGFPSWREPECIAREAELILAHRASADELPFVHPHRYCHNPIVGLSSTLVRERLARGLDARFLVPEAALRYIASRGLYR